MTPTRVVTIGCRRLAMLVAMLCVGINAPGNAQTGRGSTPPPNQACPDSTDTPDIVDYYLGTAYRAYVADPSHRLPAPCLVLTIAKLPAAFPDSTVTKTLVLTEELLKAQPDDQSLLYSQLVFLYRLRRYVDVRSTFDRFASIDSSRITLQAYKIVIAAARHDADTAAMRRYLAPATAQFPTASQLSAEYAILRQVGRLRALVDTVHRAMKADPKRTGGYASLASIYGNLETPDSVFVYIRKGLAAQAPRQEMVTALGSLVGAELRHAQIVDTPDGWEAALPVALDIDSVLSSPETKHFVALSLARVLAYRINGLNFYLSDVQLGAGRGHFESIDVTRIPRSSQDPECPSILMVLRLVAYANERLAGGGNQFAPQTVPAIANALNMIQARVVPLQRGCGSGSPLARSRR